jgi:hypothetical protein
VESTEANSAGASFTKAFRRKSSSLIGMKRTRERSSQALVKQAPGSWNSTGYVYANSLYIYFIYIYID